LKTDADGTEARPGTQVLGMQGALLAPILGPVYLDSCVVSESSYNDQALARALGRRISHVSAALPAPYRLQQPRVLPCAASFPWSREQVEKRIIVSESLPPSPPPASAPRKPRFVFGSALYRRFGRMCMCASVCVGASILSHVGKHLHTSLQNI
jgi:hypothetical protein